MKKIALILILCLLLTGVAGCAEPTPPATSPSDGETTNQPQNPDPTEQTPTLTDPDPTEQTPAATDPDPTEATEAPTEVTAPAGPQPMDLAGTWKRTHTEVEGDRNENTKATITITGASEDSLVITYKDAEFPDDNFKSKALTIEAGELYPDCGNDVWVARVASTGKYSYTMTLLEDGTLLVQCSFEFDGMPMVSYQWFVRSE